MTVSCCHRELPEHFPWAAGPTVPPGLTAQASGSPAGKEPSTEASGAPPPSVDQDDEDEDADDPSRCTALYGLHRTFPVMTSFHLHGHREGSSVIPTFQVRLQKVKKCIT